MRFRPSFSHFATALMLCSTVACNSSTSSSSQVVTDPADDNETPSYTVASDAYVHAGDALYARADGQVVAGPRGGLGHADNFFDEEVDDVWMVSLTDSVAVVGYEWEDDDAYFLQPAVVRNGERLFSEPVEFTDDGVTRMSFKRMTDTSFVLVFEIDDTSADFEEGTYILAGWVDASAETPVLTLSNATLLSSDTTVEQLQSPTRISDTIFAIGLTEGEAGKLYAAYVDEDTHALFFDGGTWNNSEVDIAYGTDVEVTNEEYVYSISFAKVAANDDGDRFIMHYSWDDPDDVDIDYRPYVRQIQFSVDTSGDEPELSVTLSERFDLPLDLDFEGSDDSDSLTYLDYSSIITLDEENSRVAIVGVVTGFADAGESFYVSPTTWIVDWPAEDDEPTMSNGVTRDPNGDTYMSSSTEIIEMCKIPAGIFGVGHDWEFDYEYYSATTYLGTISENNEGISWAPISEYDERLATIEFACDTVNNAGLVLFHSTNDNADTYAGIDVYTFDSEGNHTREEIFIDAQDDMVHMDVSPTTPGSVLISYADDTNYVGVMRNVYYGNNTTDTTLIGFAQADAAGGEDVLVTEDGIVQNDEWDLEVGSTYYSDLEGHLTLDDSTGAVVGEAIASDSILISR